MEINIYFEFSLYCYNVILTGYIAAYRYRMYQKNSEIASLRFLTAKAPFGLYAYDHFLIFLILV